MGKVIQSLCRSRNTDPVQHLLRVHQRLALVVAQNPPYWSHCRFLRDKIQQGALGEIEGAAIHWVGNARGVLGLEQLPDDMPGVDAVLPDFRWLLERADHLEACIVTHAHEDHIGGLPYLLRSLAERGATLPIYGAPFTLGMVRGKLKAAGVSVPDLIPLADHARLPIGPFDCEFLPVTHSTPSGLMTVFDTPQGRILHSSDFKLDPTPIDGRVTDLDRVREMAAEGGIRLLLADSTNAGSAGSSTSESTIGPVLRHCLLYTSPSPRDRG